MHKLTFLALLFSAFVGGCVSIDSSSSSSSSSTGAPAPPPKAATDVHASAMAAGTSTSLTLWSTLDYERVQQVEGCVDGTCVALEYHPAYFGDYEGEVPIVAHEGSV